MTPKLIEPAVATDRTREISITKEEYLFGRGADCDHRLNDEGVSRHHCLLRVRGKEVTLSDLGSSNGTFLNGRRVLSQVNLNTGDEISLGKFRFLVDLGDHPGGAIKIPDATDPFAVTREIEKEKKA